MAPISKVAILGAGGNFGTHITKALVAAGFSITVIARPESTTTYPDGLPVIRSEYAVPALTEALRGQDAVVCTVGGPGLPKQPEMMDAALAAGVSRFVIDDYGYGPNHRNVPELDGVKGPRKRMIQYAEEKAAGNPQFTWTAIAIGNPTDWALQKFSTMGFDIKNRSAIIYDSGTERWTGTTMAGIGQAVVGVLQHPDETANRWVHVSSLETCQNELLAAFEETTGEKWSVTRDTAANVLARGREKIANGTPGWPLDIVIGQLYEEGAGRSVLTAGDQSDNELLGVPNLGASGVAKEVIRQFTANTKEDK